MKINFLNFSDPKQNRYFLLTGSEIALKQDALTKILDALNNQGFIQKISLNQDEVDQAEEIISRNSEGSLFQENLIIYMKHTSGKFPESIKLLLEQNFLYNSTNIAIIIESSIEKTPTSGTWIRNLDKYGLIINCKKLKQDEEKLWLMRQLDFLPKNLLPLFGASIFQNNEKDLLNQKNEVNLLKLLFLNEKDHESNTTDHITFHSGLSAFEIEDMIINRDYKKAVETINYLKESSDQNSAPIIWIIAKIINSCLETLQSSNKRSTLKKNGVWPLKVNSYLALIKNSKTTDFLELNQELLKVDLMNKGILKPNPWEQIEKIILKLQGATS